MRYCHLLEKLPDGTFSKPSLDNRLRDASHIRAGFRVFRLPFRRVEFVLTNGTNRNWEDNNGHNYVIDVPGRYVVEHGIRRVADADANECVQTVFRPNDRFIQLCFRADLWDKCFCSFQSDDNEWTKPPGELMTLVPKDQPGRYFEISVEASRMACAFNDGGENWDSRLNNNYLIGCPGKYEVSGGAATYVSPSDKDLKAMPTRKPCRCLPLRVSG
ncbi:alpha-amylase [Gracilaria domingensis]|nr:alpha-amylase [Gracilaria domingensis]